jgi:phage gp45-like
LTDNLDVAALAGFEFSTDNSTWFSSLSLSSSFSGNIYVRLTGESVGTYSGNVSFTSTGATQVDKAVTDTSIV